MCYDVFAGRRHLLAIAAVIGSCATVTITSPSAAELLYYDPFLIGPDPLHGQYQVGPLAGQNPVMNFDLGNGVTGGSAPTYFYGPWTTPPGAAYPGAVVSDVGISYFGAPSYGGSVRVDPESYPSDDARIGRYLQTDWTDDTIGTYYVSFLANFGTTTAGMGYRAVEFWPVGNYIGQDTGRMDIGYNQWGPGGPSQHDPATARMSINVDGQGQQILENAPASYNEDGANHLIVFKFVMTDVMAEDGDGDSITVYLDPTTYTEPAIASTYFADVDYTWHAMSTVSQFWGGTTGIFDEVRVATTFEDAMPRVPEPSSLVLVLAAAAACLGYVRARRPAA